MYSGDERDLQLKLFVAQHEIQLLKQSLAKEQKRAAELEVETFSMRKQVEAFETVASPAMSRRRASQSDLNSPLSMARTMRRSASPSTRASPQMARTQTRPQSAQRSFSRTPSARPASARPSSTDRLSRRPSSARRSPSPSASARLSASTAFSTASVPLLNRRIKSLTDELASQKKQTETLRREKHEAQALHVEERKKLKSEIFSLKRHAVAANRQENRTFRIGRVAEREEFQQREAALRREVEKYQELGRLTRTVFSDWVRKLRVDLAPFCRDSVDSLLGAERMQVVLDEFVKETMTYREIQRNIKEERQAARERTEAARSLEASPNQPAEASSRSRPSSARPRSRSLSRAPSPRLKHQVTVPTVSDSVRFMQPIASSQSKQVPLNQGKKRIQRLTDERRQHLERERMHSQRRKKLLMRTAKQSSKFGGVKPRVWNELERSLSNSRDGRKPVPKPEPHPASRTRPRSARPRSLTRSVRPASPRPTTARPVSPAERLARKASRGKMREEFERIVRGVESTLHVDDEVTVEVPELPPCKYAN